MPEEHTRYVKENYVPYDYWYTAMLGDHYVNFDNIPEKVSEMLNACHPDQPGLTMK
jgi:hypothetical protein